MEQQSLSNENLEPGFNEEPRDVSPEKEPKKEDKPAQVMVRIDSNGLYAFDNQLELGNAARLAISTKVAPDHLKKEGLEAVMAALSFCKQHSLPMSAMGKMCYIRGKIQCFGSLVIALAQRHPEYGEMQIFFLDEDKERISMANKNLDKDVHYCVIRTKKKFDTEWNEFFFSKIEAEKAGLMNNPSQTYKKYLKDMLFHRAKARALEFNYASALEGVEYYEALQEPQEMKDVGPSLAEKLNLKKPEDTYE